MSGLHLSQFAKEQIFQPLGMAHTHFHDDPFQVVGKRATGYRPDENGGFKVYTTILPIIGDGGIFTSLEGLKLWDNAYYESEVLNKDFWVDMQQRGMLSKGDRAGKYFREKPPPFLPLRPKRTWYKA